ncbi:MAG: hypothetical protein ACR2LQ_07430 [Acidimicrobiales bacterium]
MTSWERAVLVVSIAMPLTAVAIARALKADVQRCARAGALVSFVGFTALLVGDRLPELGALQPDALALLAAAGAALVAAVLAGEHLVPGALALIAVAIGACAAPSGSPSAGGALLGAAGAVAVTAAVSDTAVALTVAGALGVAAAGGVALVVALPVAVLAAGRRSGAVSVALPGLLLVGLRALPPEAPGRWAAVALAGAATLLALVPPRTGQLRMLPAVPVGVWALVAATGAVPGLEAAAVLLAAAATLLVVIDLPVGLLTALPGAVALEHALLDVGGRTAVVLGALAGVTALALALTARGAAPAPAARVLAAALATWLVLRPTAWTFGSEPDLGQYQAGAASAGAAGLLATVAATAAGWVAVAAPAPLPRPPPSAVSLRQRRATVAATAVMGIVAAALLRSSSL